MKIAASLRRRLRAYAREPSVMGALLVLGIIAAPVNHLVLGAAARLHDSRERAADASVHGPLAPALLKALLTKSHTLNFKKHSYKRSYSLMYLHDSGALEDNPAGYRRLVDLANGTDHRPFALTPLYEVPPMQWIDAEVAAVQSAQEYLRAYGPRLVLQGFLDP